MHPCVRRWPTCWAATPARHVVACPNKVAVPQAGLVAAGRRRGRHGPLREKGAAPVALGATAALARLLFRHPRRRERAIACRLRLLPLQYHTNARQLVWDTGRAFPLQSRAHKGTASSHKEPDDRDTHVLLNLLSSSASMPCQALTAPTCAPDASWSTSLPCTPPAVTPCCSTVRSLPSMIPSCRHPEIDLECSAAPGNRRGEQVRHFLSSPARCGPRRRSHVFLFSPLARCRSDRLQRRAEWARALAERSAGGRWWFPPTGNQSCLLAANNGKRGLH